MSKISLPGCRIRFPDSEYITYKNAPRIKRATAHQSLVKILRTENGPSEKLDFSMPFCSILFTESEYTILFETPSILSKLQPIKVW